MTYVVLNERAQKALDALTPQQTAAVVMWVAAHESDLDCSDGPCVALDTDRDELYKAEFVCCGWAESRISFDGDPAFVVGSCYGH